MSGETHRNLKINHLLGKRGHLIIEAESVLSDAQGREYKIPLALLGPVQDGLLAGSDNRVIDIERTA